MVEFSVKPPTIPIPFHKLLKVVALADGQRVVASIVRYGMRRLPPFFGGLTSTSNKVVTNALLRRGELVLFDRNNHRSLHQGALAVVVGRALPRLRPRYARSREPSRHLPRAVPHTAKK